LHFSSLGLRGAPHKSLQRVILETFENNSQLLTRGALESAGGSKWDSTIAKRRIGTEHPTN
jgi:hypothetical protein